MRHLRAIEFRRPMKSGTKFPMLFKCNGVKGKEDAVVKFRESVWHSRFSLVCEVVASRLGTDLGFQCAEIVCVEVDESFSRDTAVEKYPKHAFQIERSPGENMGSIYLGPGLGASIPSELEMAKERVKFCEIVAFDFLIQNFDRTTKNPNFLRKSDALFLIDHEQAFGLANDTQTGNYSLDDVLVEPFLGHVFFWATDLLTDFDGLFTRFAALAPKRIDEYVIDIPESWIDPRTQYLTAYLKWAHQNTQILRTKLLSLIYHDS